MSVENLLKSVKGKKKLQTLYDVGHPTKSIGCDHKTDLDTRELVKNHQCEKNTNEDDLKFLKTLKKYDKLDGESIRKNSKFQHTNRMWFSKVQKRKNNSPSFLVDNNKLFRIVLLIQGGEFKSIVVANRQFSANSSR